MNNENESTWSEGTTGWYIGIVALAGFIGCVWLANWLLARYGVVHIGFGLEAPAGVFAAGLSFGLRDIVHRCLGRGWTLGGVLIGATLSYFIEDAIRIPGGVTSIAVASGIAFGLSELADLIVYVRLEERWGIAVAASNAVGSVIDSALFLWLAFGSLSLLTGQVVGKWLMILPSLLLMQGARHAVLRNRFGTEGS